MPMSITIAKKFCEGYMDNMARRGPQPIYTARLALQVTPEMMAAL